MDIYDVIPVVITTIVLAIVIYIIAAFCVIVPTENYCIERGWHGANVTFSFKRYCESRINQTDVIVPIDEAENRIKQN